MQEVYVGSIRDEWMDCWPLNKTRRFCSLYLWWLNHCFSIFVQHSWAKSLKQMVEITNFCGNVSRGLSIEEDRLVFSKATRPVITQAVVCSLKKCFDIAVPYYLHSIAASVKHIRLWDLSTEIRCRAIYLGIWAMWGWPSLVVSEGTRLCGDWTVSSTQSKSLKPDRGV